VYCLCIAGLKSRGVLKYKRAFCAACGLPEQNISNIIAGNNHFNLIHVANICDYYNLDANWIIHSTDNLFLSKQYTIGTQTVHKINKKEAI